MNGALRHQLLADLGRSGKSHLAHGRVGGHFAADRRGRSRDHIEGARRDAGAAALASAYEQLRGIAAGGLGGGWRYGAAVLAASGMAAWMAGAATWAPQRPPAEQRDGTAAQAGQSPSAPGQSLPAIWAEGGQNTGPACPPLPPAATSQLIAVMAQLTL